jgi:hypothetical protein
VKNNAESRATRPGLSLAILLAGSLLVAFSSGRWLAPLAAWIGPVLIIRFARDHRVSRGFPLVRISARRQCQSSGLATGFCGVCPISPIG